jgi:hypothetical protein
LKLSSLIKRLALVSILGVPSSVVLGSGVASAATCGLLPGHYFDGYLDNGGTGANYNAVYANIVPRFGNLCSGGQGGVNTFNTAWSMIKGTGSYSYAQTGFWRDTGPHQSTFQYAQYRVDAISPIVNMFGPSSISLNGVYHQYWSWFDPSGPVLRLFVDGTNMLTMTNPYLAWITPFRAQFLGETSYQESSIPGLSSTHTSYTGLQVQRQDTGLYENLPCGLVQPSVKNTRGQISASSCQAFDIWSSS